MKSVLFAAITTLLLCNVLSPALAQEAMTGVGVTTCGDYSDARERRPDGLPDSLYSEDNLYIAWAQGFLGALNAQAVLQKKPLRAIPRVDALERAIRAACTAKPQVQFFDMLSDQYNALPAAGKTAPSSANGG